jgi:hypothetical protein
MVHDIRVMLDLHPYWVVLQLDVYNTFNSMSKSAIFQELWSSSNSLDSHLFDDSTHAHPHNIFPKFLHMGIS